jgi:thiamine pyrophosphate-dependent acetolactate synthase large subunit-like protein
MLADFPSDFRYVLGLQEAVVVGMADGFAQASGKTTVANLHTAPGVGNAMGAIFNAQANHSPLLVTAGQQARAQITLQANLTNRDAIRMPHPLVKWAYEPPRAEDVPLALAHGAHLASLPPRGPVFVSLPMDDWGVEVDAGDAQAAIDRRVTGRATADPEAVRALAAQLAAAANPVLVAGPDIDASGAWDLGIALAERQRLPVWATPATGGNRLGFPEGHPNFRGVLPPAIGPVAQTLEAHDLILVVGSSVFPYYPYIPGPLLPEGAKLAAITSDPDEAARAPMGDAIVADVKLTLEALLEAVAESSRPAPSRTQARRKSRRPTRSTPRPSTRRSARYCPRTRSSCSSRRQHAARCATSCASRGRAATTSAPAAASASASPPRSASSSPSPTARSSACSARARPSTRSAPSGAPRPTTSGHLPRPQQQRVRDPQVVRRGRAGAGAPGLDLPRSTSPRSPLATASPRAGERPRRGPRRALEALASSEPELVEVPVEPGMSLF